MANPLVRPHLYFYPERSIGRSLSEARQAERWLSELPDDQLTPMARFRDGDYFVHEPAMLTDGRFCMPVRWFTKAETGPHLLYAKCWELRPVINETGSGWRVIKHKSYEVPARMFLKNLPTLSKDAATYGVPAPEHIIGKMSFSLPYRFAIYSFRRFECY